MVATADSESSPALGNGALHSAILPKAVITSSIGALQRVFKPTSRDAHGGVELRHYRLSTIYSFGSTE